MDLKVSPLGNPAMPMKMPFGPAGLRHARWTIPSLIMAGRPEFETLATGLMKETAAQQGMATIEELRQLCIDASVKLIPCQMTGDLFG